MGIVVMQVELRASSSSGEGELQTLSSGEVELGASASSTGKEERHGGHLYEPGCQPTGMQSGLRGSGWAEKQTRQCSSFECRPRPSSKEAAWVLSRKRVVGQ